MSQTLFVMRLSRKGADMLEMLKEAGFIMWLTIFFGLGGLVLAVLTVRRPSLGRIDVCESAQKTLLVTTFSCFAAALSQTAYACSLAIDAARFPGRPELWNATLWRRIFFEGLSECLALPIVGLGFVGVIALLLTVARMRLPNR
jgi:hypothetical protein